MFGLNETDRKLIAGVFERHPNIANVQIFGSRAMGNFRPNSDIDIALWGQINHQHLGKIIADLDDLPLPYQFDVVLYDDIKNNDFKKHIDEFGIDFYSY